MSLDAIVRVSFESSTAANDAANKALVGHLKSRTGKGPLSRIGTAAYSCRDADEREVANTLAALGQALVEYAQHLDFAAITIARKASRKRRPSGKEALADVKEFIARKRASKSASTRA